MRTLDGELHKWVTLREAIGDLLKVQPMNYLHSNSCLEHIVVQKDPKQCETFEWSARVLDLDRPSYTITEKHRCGQLVQISSGYRRLTVRECMRIQSFPDWYVFTYGVSTSRKYKLVGEAVPPVMAYRLAVHIGELMGWKARPPKQDEWDLPYFHRVFCC